MKSLFLCLKILSLSFLMTFPASIFAATKECVILLHGLIRSHSAMAKLESALKKNHYIVISQDYPSTTKSIQEIADNNIEPMIQACMKYDISKIHFVTHSMGGIVLQLYLQNHQITRLGRIVMLSPPNHGSQIADLLHNNWLYHKLTGPAGQELTTDKNSTPNKIQLRSTYDIGIIAGTFNFIPFGNYLFPDANDGAVSVSSTKTDAMQDFIAVSTSHPFIMDNPITQFQIFNFLKSGHFKKIVYIKK